ncbi:MAG TPA: hypothetical protein VHQ20_02545 [Patescibacteria group bacterium]|jgi:hypothetical protein|nr:hypothetical protein [Patescibacteria group bacterium]
MFEFIEQHKKIAIGFMVTVILVLLALLFVVYGKAPNTTPTNTGDNNQANYGFLKQNISQEDKLLMISAKILVEEYGTYSDVDSRSLHDLQNQSTDEFKTKVQNLIDGITKGQSIITVVNPDSISLQKTNQEATLLMDGVTTDEANKTVNKHFVISLIKQNNYWVADNIIVSQ